MHAATRYAKSGGIHIAYQMMGAGPLDLVLIPGSITHLEYQWEEPRFTRMLRGLASFSRLICFDKRGTGLSDRVAQLPTLEQRMDDVRAVMDAVGIERASLIGISEGGPMSILFAATYPARTAALVLYGTYARSSWAPDYPFGRKAEDWETRLRVIEREWGGPVGLERWAPSAASDEAFRNWWATYLRLGASPAAAVAMVRMAAEIDVRHVLPAVQVPTLVLHRTGDIMCPIESARFLADRITGARFVELPGADHLPFVGDTDALLGEIEEFLTGARHRPEPDRALATVLFTDIVGATERASELGDGRWRDLLLRHHAIVRQQLEQHRGHEIDTAGDGFLATFDGPARGIRCAAAISAAVRPLGVRIRAGLHTGECEVIGASSAASLCTLAHGLPLWPRPMRSLCRAP
ncbi:MAG: adenylate/guanylate cyclase domain-containing protein [Candidatus Rokuibacteriota bacterium]